jgi:NO-binding membrane sensor protein with MHYT domain
MTSWQLTRVIAGSFILLSLALGVRGSPLYHSSYWLWFTAFVGANLLQSGVTRWCLMERILRGAGLKPSAD